jgi:hypothetical protein
MKRVHYLRTIRDCEAYWVHCGRPVATTTATRRLEDVTCQVCRRYIAKGLAYGYQPHEEGRH